MKVIFLGRGSRRTDSLPIGDEDVIELLSNNWDDFGYKTTFATVCRIGGRRFELGTIRLLIANQENSSRFLDAHLENDWDGTFPIPGVDYISTPSEIAFYEQLDGALPDGGAVSIAASLRDASYLVHLTEDNSARIHAQSYLTPRLSQPARSLRSRIAKSESATF